MCEKKDAANALLSSFFSFLSFSVSLFSQTYFLFAVFVHLLRLFLTQDAAAEGSKYYTQDHDPAEREIKHFLEAQSGRKRREIK